MSFILIAPLLQYFLPRTTFELQERILQNVVRHILTVIANRQRRLRRQAENAIVEKLGIISSNNHQLHILSGDNNESGQCNDTITTAITCCSEALHSFYTRSFKEERADASTQKKGISGWSPLGSRVTHTRLEATPIPNQKNV